MLRPSLCLLPLLAVLLTAAPAAARVGPCTPAATIPECQVWTGKVSFVADGDTLDVDLDGDGTRRPARVRITGIQAMELTRYTSYPSRRRGECHGLAAAARVERLLRAGRGRVRVTAQNPASRSGGRLRRSIAARIGGRWRDVGSALLAEGHALWLPNPVEYAWNATYHRLAAGAAAAGQRLWDPAACRPGPSAGADLAADVNWDADGNDFANVNGEWVEIANRSAFAAPVGGWTVRDSALRRFRLPAGTVVPAGGSIRVRVGSGTPTASTFYWGMREPVFENASADGRGIGDGAYLFDADGDLRAHATYA